MIGMLAADLVGELIYAKEIDDGALDGQGGRLVLKLVGEEFDSPNQPPVGFRLTG